MQRISLPQQPIMPPAHSTAADTGASGCPMPVLSLRKTVAKSDRPPEPPHPPPDSLLADRLRVRPKLGLGAAKAAPWSPPPTKRMRY